jgi:hypothetical protein
MASKKPAIHGYDHLPGGPDPIPSVGIANDWMEASSSVSAATDVGAPSSPSPVPVPFSSISKTSDTTGNVYIPKTGSPDYIAVGPPGGYEACAIVSYPTGMTGYISVSVVIQGDAWLGVTDFPGYIPASYSGTGGGVAVYRLPFAVLDTAVLGTATEVGVHADTWQNSGSTRTAAVTLQIKRLT